MTTQPEALRLADVLAGFNHQYTHKAATELRRLHEAHAWQHTMAGERLRRIEKDELLIRQALEALEKYRHMMFFEAGCRWGGGDEAIAALRERLGEVHDE